MIVDTFDLFNILSFVYAKGFVTIKRLFIYIQKKKINNFCNKYVLIFILKHYIHIYKVMNFIPLKILTYIVVYIFQLKKI